MSSKNLGWSLLLGGVLVALCSDTAWAWGPATHVRLASDLLAQAGLLSAGLATLLLRHASHFLYGNIAADVILGKRFSKVKHSCHQWKMAWTLLDAADSDEGRAFGYGYLAHLAADTVAHGKYLPRQLLLTRTTLNFGHLFWELRADACVEAGGWERLHGTLIHPFPQHERLLAGHLVDTMLPFEVNLRVFNRMNLLTCERRWRRTVRRWHTVSRWDLDLDVLHQYRTESVARMRLAIEDPHSPQVTQFDPSGAATLAQIKRDRRMLRRLGWQGVDGRWLARNLAAGYAPTVEVRPSVA